MHKLIIAAAASAALAGCTADMGADPYYAGPPGAPMPGPGAMPADMTPEERTAFTRMAASSDLFEIQSSQLALGRSRNPAIRQFADMMIRDHTNMSRQLMTAAQAAGVPPMQPMLLPMHADMLRDLEASGTGPQFDDAYARIQVMAHEMALALHGNYAQNGDAGSLRAVAGTAVGPVRQHLQLARQWPVR